MPVFKKELFRNNYLCLCIYMCMYTHVYSNLIENIQFYIITFFLKGKAKQFITSNAKRWYSNISGQLGKYKG